uniref:DNA helicase n=1 Tax=Tanacetum cinerariifolium TaxID=118510 RepID=A0A6L2KRL6_TANCI|nr:DNA helicase [Tanacetum cinerariifolium]
MSSNFSDTRDDVDQFGDSSIRKNTVAPQQGADTGGGNVMAHLFARRADLVDATTVPVSRIFDRLRHMCLDTRGNSYRQILHQNESVQRADRQLVSHTRAHVFETVSLHTQGDMLGHMPSSSLVDPLNHTYLCMDVMEHTIRPQIISFSDSSLKDGSKTAANQRSTFSSRTAGDSRARLVANSKESLANLGVTTPPGDHSNFKVTALPLCYIKKNYSCHFMEHIQAYNQMFAMTSFGAKVDDSVNKGRWPYISKVSWHIYHWIGSLCPKEGHDQRFLQLYIYDTQDEVANRMRNFGGRHLHTLNPQIVEGQLRGCPPQRINKEHQSYMSLQYPLLFVFGQSEFYPEMVLKPKDGIGQGNKLSMNAYYKYHLHPWAKDFGLIFRCGRLFQQYVVTVFYAIEQYRLDWVRKNQKELRSDYLLGLYDAVSKGDREGIQAGSMVMLPRTFTGGPRYMYNHYLDALPICRLLGNPHYFITFMCNLKWPEIKWYMARHLGLTPSDIADIVCRVFEQMKSIKNQRIQSQRAVRDKETEKLKLYGFTKTFSTETKKEISN